MTWSKTTIAGDLLNVWAVNIIYQSSASPYLRSIPWTLLESISHLAQDQKSTYILFPANLCLQLCQAKDEDDTELLAIELQACISPSRAHGACHFRGVRMHMTQGREHAWTHEDQLFSAISMYPHQPGSESVQRGLELSPL